MYFFPFYFWFFFSFCICYFVDGYSVALRSKYCGEFLNISTIMLALTSKSFTIRIKSFLNIICVSCCCLLVIRKTKVHHVGSNAGKTIMASILNLSGR